MTLFTDAGVEFECKVYRQLPNEIILKRLGDPTLPGFPIKNRNLNERKFVTIRKAPMAINLMKKHIELFDRPGEWWLKHPGYENLLYFQNLKPVPELLQSPFFPPKNNLNGSQQKALEACLDPNRPFVVILGPSGSGKKRVVSEIILEVIFIHFISTNIFYFSWQTKGKRSFFAANIRKSIAKFTSEFEMTKDFQQAIWWWI